MKDDRLERLEATIRKQDADHEARIREITEPPTTLDPTDTDRVTLLDRVAERMPDLDLDIHEIEWQTLPDGAEALIVEGGGMDGGGGFMIANSPAENDDDLHVIGPTAPLFPARSERSRFTRTAAASWSG